MITSNALHASTEYLISDVYIESIIPVFIYANILLVGRSFSSQSLHACSMLYGIEAVCVITAEELKELEIWICVTPFSYNFTLKPAIWSQSDQMHTRTLSLFSCRKRA
jgi:hypothetical protein